MYQNKLFFVVFFDNLSENNIFTYACMSFVTMPSRLRATQKNVFTYFFSLPEYKEKKEEDVLLDALNYYYAARHPELTENGFTKEFEAKMLRDEKDPENISSGPYETADDFMAALYADIK